MKYPEIVEFLTIEYGLHCVGCFIAEFETLEEGAVVHGILGDDFEDMLKLVNEKAQKIEEQRKV